MVSGEWRVASGEGSANGEGLLGQPRPHGVAARACAPLGLEARPVASEVVAPHRLKPRCVVRLDAERAWFVSRLVNELASKSGTPTGVGLEYLSR